MLCAKVIRLKGVNDVPIVIADVEVLMRKVKVQRQGFASVCPTHIVILIKEVKGSSIIHFSHKVYPTEVLVNPLQLKRARAAGSAVGP